MGTVDPSVAQKVERDLEYAVRELRTADPLELADLLIAGRRRTVHGVTMNL